MLLNGLGHRVEAFESCLGAMYINNDAVGGDDFFQYLNLLPFHISENLNSTSLTSCPVKGSRFTVWSWEVKGYLLQLVEYQFRPLSEVLIP